MRYTVLVAILFLLAAIPGLIGCFPLGNQSTSPNGSGPETVISPTIQVKAELVSINQGTIEKCIGTLPFYCIDDQGTVKIKEILSKKNPSNVTLKDFDIKDTIDATFLYSTRPAKIKYLPRPDNQASVAPNSTASSSPSMLPLKKEDGYLIFRVQEDSISEVETVTLPGIGVGDVIMAGISVSGKLKGVIGRYTVSNGE